MLFLSIATIFNIFWPKNAIGLIFIAVNGQILNKQSSHLVTLMIAYKCIRYDAF